MSTAIDVTELHVSIGGSHILQGVSLQVATGEVVALLGRNGVGKTTTLRALMGLVPRSGTIHVRDQDVTRWPPHRIARLGVAYVPEDRDVFSALTVAENLRLAEQVAAPNYDTVYELFPELRQRARQRAGTLSGGQQQMVAVARALLNEWPVLIVDEPSKGLAPRLVSELTDVLVRVSTTTTMLVVEQNLAVVRRLA